MEGKSGMENTPLAVPYSVRDSSNSFLRHLAEEAYKAAT